MHHHQGEALKLLVDIALALAPQRCSAWSLLIFRRYTSIAVGVTSVADAYMGGHFSSGLYGRFWRGQFPVF